MKYTYICPECHSKLIFKDNISRFRLRKINWKKSDILYPEVIPRDDLYNVFCVNCGTHMFYVDNNIADTIIALISAGLKIKCSCSGHPKDISRNPIFNDDSTKYPYILFDSFANEILRQIPSDFYYRCIAKYNLINFEKSKVLERPDLYPVESAEDAKNVFSYCFCIGFKYEFSTITDRHGNIHIKSIHGKEYISEYLKQIKSFSEELIEQVNKIYENKRIEDIHKYEGGTQQ